MENLFLKNDADLRDINLELNKGEKLAVLSEKKGRSTLLILAAAGELELIEGKYSKNGSTVYQGITMYFVEDTILQNVILGLEFDKQKYVNIIKMVGLEQFMRGVNQSENALLIQNGAFLPEDIKRLLILARLMYIDADIYVIDKFFDYFPNKFIDTALSYIVNNFFKDKTMLVATDNLHVANLFPNCIVLAKRTIQARLQSDQLAHEYRHFFNQTNFFNFDDLKVDKDEPFVQHEEYVTLLSNYEKNWYQQQKEIIKGYNIEQKVKHLGDYFLSNLKKARPLKRAYVLGRFFLFNSGWVLPTITVTLILVNFLAAYSFTCFVISWKQKFFNMTESEYMNAFVAINTVLVVSIILMNHIMISYVRRIATKLFVYTIKALLVHSLEWFQASPLEKIASSVITEFNYFEENISDAMRTYITVFIKLHVALLICLYNTHFTGVFIVLIYVLIIAALVKVVSGIRYVRDIVCCNQSYLIHVSCEWFRGLVQFRNYGKVEYYRRCFMMISEIYHNSKSHQGGISERWLFTRIHGFVLFVPILLIINGIIRYWIGWEKDFFEIIKITISFDLVFTIGPLVNSTILQSALLTVLERLRSIIIEDEIAKKRKVMAIGATSFTHGQKVILKINEMVIVNPLTKSILLCAIQMDLNTGAKMAVTGPRGSGKRTLLESVYRLVDPRRILTGSIYFKGQNILNMSDDLFYSSVMMLTASYRLVPGSIRDNLDPKRKHSDHELVAVLTYLGYWRLLEYETGIDFRREMGKSVLNIQSTVINFHSKAFQGSLKDDIDDIKSRYNIKVTADKRIPRYERTHEVFLNKRQNEFDEQIKNVNTRDLSPKKKLEEFKNQSESEFRDFIKEGFLSKSEAEIESNDEMDNDGLDEAVIDPSQNSYNTLDRLTASNRASLRSSSKLG